MKIALVSPYDFAYPGGVTNHISSLARQLTLMGHEIKVFAPASKAVATLGDEFIPMGKARPVPVRGSVVRISLSLRLASTIKASLEKEKFDIIHLHEPFAPMLCSSMLRFSNTVNIGTFHACDGMPGYNIYKFGRPISTIMLRRRLRKLNGKIAVSFAAKQFASKYVSGDYHIIPNGVDAENFCPEAVPIDKFTDEKQNIVFVGRLERRKGLRYLLKAYQEVKHEIPDSRLIVVGPGDRARRKYEKWTKRHGLADVVFAGYVPYTELPCYYQTAKVFCSPAIGRESFGIVLLEAMIMGKPIVATNIEGYAGVVTHGKEGLLVPPKNSGALAQALISLLKDEKLQEKMGAAGKVTAQEYRWEQVAQKVFDYYVKVINETSGRK
ncbi:MAG: glycosyltransferase family 4 protein [Dehalococcoidales bacterium]|nr:glycosyltransferase family 4 protein [Dehalococcoidales bacterium]